MRPKLNTPQPRLELLPGELVSNAYIHMTMRISSGVRNLPLRFFALEFKIAAQPDIIGVAIDVPLSLAKRFPG